MKYLDDITIIGCITKNDDSSYCKEINILHSGAQRITAQTLLCYLASTLIDFFFFFLTNARLCKLSNNFVFLPITSCGPFICSHEILGDRDKSHGNAAMLRVT